MKVILPINGSQDRYPKGNLIQGFGENPGLYNLINMKAHNGWDLVQHYGADVVAPHDGIVAGLDFQGQGYGNRLDILSPTENGYAIMSTLGHMTEQKLVKIGDEVKAGQVIGKMGNSGFVVSGGVMYWGGSNPDKKGTHTHWTVKRYKSITPEEGQGIEYNEWFGRKLLLQNANNGYAGAFNPGELLKGTNVQLVNDKGTIFLVTGNKDKRKIGLADLDSLGLFGDEPQVMMDTTGIPEYNTIVAAKSITHK